MYCSAAIFWIAQPLEDLPGVMVSGILLPDIAHVIEKLVHQLLGLGIDLAGRGLRGGSFHGAGTTCRAWNPTASWLGLVT